MNHDRVTDAVRGAQRGRAACWATLHDEVNPALAAYIRMLDGAEDVDDVLQATWVQVMTDVEQLRDPESFSAWIRTIARRQVYRATADVRQRSAQERHDWCRTGDVPTPEDLLLEAEERDKARRCLAQLRGRSREVAEWRIVDERETDEVAAATGLSAESVHVALSRARGQLRAAFDRLPLIVPPSLLGWWRRADKASWPAVVEGVAIVVVVAVVGVSVGSPPPAGGLEAAAGDATSAVQGRPEVNDASASQLAGGARLSPAGRPAIEPSPVNQSATTRSADGDERTDLVRPLDDGPSVFRRSADLSDEAEPDVHVDLADHQFLIWIPEPAEPAPDFGGVPAP